MERTTPGDPWLFRWVSWALTGCGSLAHCVHCPKRGQSGQVEALSSLPFLSRHVPTFVEDTHPQAGCHFLVVNVNNVIVRGPVGLRYCVEHVPLTPLPHLTPPQLVPFVGLDRFASTSVPYNIWRILLNLYTNLGVT